MKIETLSRDRKLEILQASREKKRREKLAKPKYVPNEGQLQVHKSLAEDRWCCSGNGSGKTTMAIQEAMWAAQGYNPVLDVYTHVPCRVIVVIDLPSKIMDLWIPGMQEWFDIKEDWFRRHGKPYVSELKFPNGSSIKFMTHDQPDLATESIELDVALYDEPCPRRMFIGLKRGSRTKGRKARHLFIGTPISAAWIKTDIYDRWVQGELPNTEFFKFGTSVNKNNLAEGYIEAFSNILTEKERRVRLEGDFFNIDGFALAHIFKRSTHIIAKEVFKKIWDPARYPVVIAIDPHPSKAHVACALAAGPDGQIYYIKETQQKMVAKDFAKHLKEWSSKLRVVDIVVDSLGSADGTGNIGFKSFIQVLNENGVRCRATSFDEKSDEGLIERFRTILQVPETPNNFGQFLPKLQVLEGCLGIIKDVENVAFLKYKDLDIQKEKLDMRNTDFLSCLKYALATGVTYNKGSSRIYKPKRLYGF